jgi:Peptidase family M28
MSPKKNYRTAVSLIIIIATIYWSFNSLMPKRITSLVTPKTEFSAERALVHLKEITQKPHYVGSENHQKVREYLIAELEKLGLNVEVQTQMVFNQKWRAGSNTKNILARIKGSGNGRALLLLSHYDSSPHSSLGASDAGSGVVTILEGIRAFLAKNKTPKNDIIILISDAEELGLLGAIAFVNHHPWAKNVGLVLNFEARGSGGPSYMLMETNGGNKNLVKAFNNANPKYPVANSLMYSIYKMLPNDTDLTVFREDGNINGYNFAFIDDHYDYHTKQDSYKRLDENTLQHQADYLMPLLYYFANADLENLSAGEDFVFFNFPGFNLINYPFSWVSPLLIFTILVFLFLIFIGFKLRKLVVKQILVGFLPLLISLIISGLLAFLGWKLILKLHPQYQDILHGFTYNGHYYISAFIALTLWLTLVIYKIYFLRNNIVNLFIAPIFIWILINFAISVYLPGAGFFIIPVIISLLIFAILLFSKENQNKPVILFSVLIIPIIVIFAPLIQMLPIGLGLKLSAISTVLTVLVIGLIIPIFSFYKNVKILSTIFLLIGILLLVSGTFTSKYSEDRKNPNSILYVLDTDKNEAFWASYNSETDSFTKQYLGDTPTSGTFIKNLSTSKYATNFKLYKKTKVLDLAEPNVEIITDTIVGNKRIINLNITPKRKVNRIEIRSENILHFSSFAMNGETLKLKKNEDYIFSTEKSKLVLSYYFTNNYGNLDIKFTIPKDEKPGLEIIETSYDIFSNPLIKSLTGKIKPRSEVMMSMPFVLNDAVVIKKRIVL